MAAYQKHRWEAWARGGRTHSYYKDQPTQAQTFADQVASMALRNEIKRQHGKEAQKRAECK